MTDGDWRTAPTPYVLPTPAFGLRALAALAGKAPLGGAREVVLGCFLGARLAGELLQENSLSEPARCARAVAARAWLMTLSLPSDARAALLRLIAASTAPAAVTAAALREVGETVESVLDTGSRAELERLARALAS